MLFPAPPPVCLFSCIYLISRTFTKFISSFSAGRTTLGHGPVDISIQGPGVAAQHCYIENRSGVITLHPCGNLCAVDGLQVSQPVRLSQGRTASAWCSLTFYVSYFCAGITTGRRLSASSVNAQSAFLNCYRWKKSPRFSC